MGLPKADFESGSDDSGIYTVHFSVHQKRLWSAPGLGFNLIEAL